MKCYCLLAPTAAWFLALAMTACQPASSPKEELPTFRNILFLISDDLATHAVGCYGNEIIHTPNLDRLGAEGVRFSRAYANSPMCTPSRGSFITGLYPHAAGVTLLRTALPDSVFTVAEYLHETGFATGIFGKNHFNSDLKHGFDTIVDNSLHRAYLEKTLQNPLPDSIRVRPTWKPFRDPARIWLNADGATSGNWFEHSQATFFARSTIDFIRRNQDRRFFAVASFNEPHSPFNFPVEYQGKYPPERFVLPVASGEDDRWVPAVFQDLTDDEKRGITRSYYTSVEYMDRNVGLLLDELDQLGLADSTLVVLIGDHGYLLNHHGRFEKHMMWEESVTTPLIVRGYLRGKKVDIPVELADLAPTMVEALGLPPMPKTHGRKLQPLLNGSASEHKPYIFSEYLTDNKAMIFDGRWKYVFTSGKKDLGSGYETGKGPSGILHRLYDLENDPKETTNVAAAPENKAVLERLQQALVQRFRETDPRAPSIPTTGTVNEQLTAFCEPPEGVKVER